MNANSKLTHNAQVFSKIAQKYTDEYFNDDTDFPYIDRFLKKIKPRGRILDIACGPGMLTKHLLEKGFQAEGIDLSAEMIAIARQKVHQASFKVMDMRHLDFPDGYFDGLLITYGLAYIPSSELHATLVGIRRILHASGSIFMINQEGKGDHSEAEPMKPNETLYVNFFTPQSLADALGSARFSVTSQEVIPVDYEYATFKNVIYTIAQ